MDAEDFFDRDTDHEDEDPQDEEPGSNKGEEKNDDEPETDYTALDFIEKEAELSGDEASSDEDEDEEADEEQQEIDEDVPDDDEQRDQIGKLFAKQQQDEDERQLLLYQERLFQDGEFHMDGKQRKRKFQWRKADNNVWLDQADDSDEEDEDAANDDMDEDDDKNPELIDIYSQVKINVKENTGENAEGTSVNSVLTDTQLTRPTAFSGPASSILSYIVRDRKTVEFLSGKSSSPQALLMRKNFVKKRKVKRLTDHF